MNRRFFIILSFFIIFLCFTTVYAYNPPKENNMYVVRYGSSIQILGGDATITSSNSSIARVSGNNVFIDGVGKFKLTIQYNSKSKTLDFFSWNVYLKNGRYLTYGDINRTQNSDIISSRIYIATTGTGTMLKIEDFLSLSTNNKSSLIGKYIVSYYDSKNDTSLSNYYAYSMKKNTIKYDFALSSLDTLSTSDSSTPTTPTTPSTGHVDTHKTIFVRINEKYHRKYCYDCKKYVEDLTAHTYSNGVCTVCGQKQTSSPITIPSGHLDTHKTIVIRINDKVHRTYCYDCKQYIEPATEHTFSNGVCTICGQKQPTTPTTPETPEETEPEKLTGRKVGEIMANAARIMLKHKSSFGYNVFKGSAVYKKTWNYWVNSRHVRTSSKQQYRYFMNCEGFCQTVIAWSIRAGRSDVCQTYSVVSKFNVPSVTMTINGKKYSGAKVTSQLVEKLIPGDILIWRGRSHLGMYVGNGRVIEMSDGGLREVSAGNYNGSRVLKYIWRPTDKLAEKLDVSKMDPELTRIKW